ncbi:guanosine polyphosphate pyrophosphohydrolase [Mycobacterium antarcticum]|uniref:HD domain-containing protein n=1 Tax=Mycolicibacterium sp. TUM20985 TaxID=3023370 RepID=UPI002572829C|nr:HD domain-containing protein [Mycolicibacterium sp. TUM20985]BDX34293.1 guanosine polyphosphate pyrophosphohydrolase [Mycolicibacterium sp. TUM20985]
MPERTTTPRLSTRFDEALAYTSSLHRRQTRKGGDIPYVGHLLSVASLVIEGGGTEAQTIAALLHDAVEDQGGAPVLAEIREKFGDEVAQIVAECSDTDVVPKPPWQERKQHYVDHLGEASEATILVSLADKLDNARAILRDYRQQGDELWQRFNVKDPEMHLWYYRSLLTVFKQRNTTWLVAELDRVYVELEQMVRTAATA